MPGKNLPMCSIESVVQLPSLVSKLPGAPPCHSTQAYLIDTHVKESLKYQQAESADWKQPRLDLFHSRELGPECNRSVERKKVLQKNQDPDINH